MRDFIMLRDVNMQIFTRTQQLIILLTLSLLLCQCGPLALGGNMGGPSEELRASEIAQEAMGDFYYGRRYYVHKTRFWGYLRRPGEPARKAKLVVFLESAKLCPDRLPEDGPAGQKYGFDHNYEYRIWGQFTGRNVYDINSNQFLPEFLLQDYQLVNRQPGWLFRPSDRYDPKRITLLPR